MNKSYFYPKELCIAVIEQAISDYISCVNSNRLKDRIILEEDIIPFFESEWCDYILSECKFTGTDILRALERRFGN